MKKYKLRPYEFEKISLSYFDDKRYVLDDGIRTWAYCNKDGVTGGKEIEKDCDKKYCNKEDCDDWIGLWWLKKNAIKKIHAFNKMNFSSNVNEVIRSVLKSLFFYEKILHTPKAPKAQRRNQAKAQNATSE